MKLLERKVTKSERIVAKGKFSCWIFACDFLLAAALGGIIAVLWIYGRQIENFFTKTDAAAQYLIEENLRWAILGAGVFVALVALLQGVSRYMRELIVTEDKFLYREGILSTFSVMIPLGEIKIIESRQNALQKLLNYGSINIISDAETPYVMKNIVAPDRLARRVMRQISYIRKENALGSNMRIRLSQNGK